MQASRRPEPTIETTAPAPEPEAKPEAKKRTTTIASKAASLFTKLADLDNGEQQELAASPADIRGRYELKREKALAEAAPEVRELALKMRAP